MLIADRNLYLTADRSRVVEEDDLDQRSLLVGRDCELSEPDADAYGIEVDDGRLVVKGCKQVAEPAEDKQADAPAENKAIIPPEKKRRAPRKARRRS